MKWPITAFLLLIGLSAVSQSTKIGRIDFYPLGDSKPERALFGTLAVFENNVVQTGKTINLHIEVLPAKTGENKNDPMFILMGGPGQASSDLIGFFADIFSEMNQERDLVFIDQRGTGQSNPLNLLVSYDEPQDYFNDALMSDQIVRNSYQSLTKNHDLTKYGTLQAAIDIESVRVAMGYPKINIYGTSYGTRLAMVYINKFPGKVRTATLKGLVPPDLVIPLDFARDAQDGLEQLIDACQTDEACSAAFPNFDQAFDLLMNQPFPIEVEMTNPETHLPDTILLTKASVALVVRSLLSVPTFTQQIPFFVSEANKGNYQILTELILRIKRSSANGISTGMRLCVICYEDYPKISEANLGGSDHTFLKDIWVNRVNRACQIWNPSLHQAPNVQYTNHHIPVLLISGARDAATPPKYGENVLKYFKNGKHIIVNNAGHSFDRMLDCVDLLINDFVINGSTQNLNLGCLNSIEFPDFRVE